MKCKLYFKNPVQTFVLDGTKEVIADNYISDNELWSEVVSIKSYGKVLKMVIRNSWGTLEKIKIKSLSSK